MSNKQTRRSTCQADGFRGISASSAMDGIPSAVDIQNFRIMGDGSLKKRTGYIPLHVSQYNVRAYIVTQIGGDPYIYTLRLYNVFLSNLRTLQTRIVGGITSSSGNAHFFYHKGTLFLMTDKKLYTIDDQGVYNAMGYVPLVGKDWHNNVIGEIYEERNLLHNHARMTYVIQDPPSVYLRSPYPIQSVLSVTRNGALLTPTDDYYLDLEFNTVNVLGSKAGDRITVYLTFADDPSYPADRLYSCSQNVLLGNTDASRILFFGGGEDATVFCSSHVSGESLKESKALCAQSTALYFPAGNEFTVGNGQFPIQGATHDRDHILFFTQGNTWIAKNTDAEKGGLATSGMVPVGCASPNGVIKAANDSISIGPSTIYRWEASADGTLRAVSISQSVDPYWDQDFYRRAQLCFDPSNNELWVNDPEKRTIWICRLDTGDWFRYADLYATALVWLGERMGFISENILYFFSSDSPYDWDLEQNHLPIHALYKASLGDLGSPEIKSVCQVTFHGATHGEPVSLSIDGGDLPKPLSLSFATDKENSSSVVKKRCRSGRFRCADLSIRADGNSTALIRRITIDLH